MFDVFVLRLCECPTVPSLCQLILLCSTMLRLGSSFNIPFTIFVKISVSSRMIRHNIFRPIHLAFPGKCCRKAYFSP